MGGEKPDGYAKRTEFLGSPPRGRGKAITPARGAESFRITPAWAGKRKLLYSFRATLQDHPRVGGEKKLRIELSQPHAGSPPRGRGKGLYHPIRPGALRITPAWAGKRKLLYSFRATLQDHPRVGGEKKLRIELSQPHAGSPPRGRGKVPCATISTHCLRITPAWAGKSSDSPQ